MLFQNKLQVSRSQVLQSFWSALMTTKFWKNPKKKKTISDWSKRRVHHTKVTLPIKKNCEDIDLILTVLLSNLRVEMMRKKIFWCKMTKPRYNGILNGVFWKSFNLFLKDSYWIFQICKQLCCTTTKTTIYCTQAIYVVMTNECFCRGVLNN